MKTASLYLPYGNGRAFGSRVHGRLLTSAELRDLGSATRLLDSMQLFVNNNQHVINMPMDNDPAALEAAFQVFSNKLMPLTNASLILPPREVRHKLLAMAVGSNAIRGHGASGANRVPGVVDGALGTLSLWMLSGRDNSVSDQVASYTVPSSQLYLLLIGGGGGGSGNGGSGGAAGGAGAVAEGKLIGQGVGLIATVTSGQPGRGSSGNGGGGGTSSYVVGGVTIASVGGGVAASGATPGAGGTVSTSQPGWYTASGTAGSGVTGGNVTMQNGNVNYGGFPSGGGPTTVNGPDVGGGGCGTLALVTTGGPGGPGMVAISSIA